MAGRDARWIVIIVRGPRRRYLQPCRSKIGRSARLNSAIWSSGLATAEETDCRLLGRRQCESIGEACDVTCNKSAIVTPGKCAPRAVSAPLVSRACGLLKLLVMVDWKRNRRVKENAEIIGVIRKFPEIVGIDLKISAERLLHTGVKLVSAAGTQ